MKTIIFSLMLTVGMNFLLIANPPLDPIDSCFFKKISAIDSNMVFKQLKIPKEMFPFFNAVKNASSKSLHCAELGSYIVCIAQNIFEEGYIENLSAANVLVYSRRTKKFAVFAHTSSASTECRNSVNLAEILPYSNQCYVFDSNFREIGMVAYQYYLNDNKTMYTFVKQQDGKKIEATTRISDFDKFNGKLNLFLDFDHFVSFLDLIFFPSKKHEKRLNWTDYDANSYYVSVIENSPGNKTPEKFSCH